MFQYVSIHFNIIFQYIVSFRTSHGQKSRIWMLSPFWVFSKERQQIYLVIFHIEKSLLKMNLKGCVNLAGAG